MVNILSECENIYLLTLDTRLFSDYTYINLEAIRKNATRGYVRDVIEGRARKNAGDTAPAHGLYLNRVFYGDDFCI